MRGSAVALSLGLAGGVGALLPAGDAAAYCRTSSCLEGMPHTAAVCDPPQETDCGKPLFWASRCVGYSVQEGASREVTFAQTEQVMHAAFATWAGASCLGGGMPQMAVTEAAPAVCDKHEYNSNASNANIILYHDTSWPYEGTANTLALTTVTYNIDTGEIYDADMELNSADNDFTLGTSNVEFDLQSIVTHETGHFQGLAHSGNPTAVMWPEYTEHTVTLRTLTPDDEAGLCAVYPPSPVNNDCDATPRHGFSPLCAAQQPPPPKACSAAAPGRDAGSGPPAGATAALGVVFLAWRRARRPSAPAPPA